MTDLSTTIAPKSDQLNSDDLISGPITVRITKVTASPSSPEQPINISYEGDGGKPYKPCKSMRRVLVNAWGRDGSKYPGRSMTLYRDPTVKWGGIEVGGIRISHLSDIAETVTMALTATRASRKPYTVKPLTTAKSSTHGGTAMVFESAAAMLSAARLYGMRGEATFREWYGRLTAEQQRVVSTINSEIKAMWKTEQQPVGDSSERVAQEEGLTTHAPPPPRSLPQASSIYPACPFGVSPDVWQQACGFAVDGQAALQNFVQTISDEDYRGISANAEKLYALFPKP
jgi:hypothetical protein